jgi:hypothetical protein
MYYLNVKIKGILIKRDIYIKNIRYQIKDGINFYNYMIH